MKKTMMILSILSLALVACKKEKKNTVSNPTNPNEEELITTFKIVFTDVNGVLPNVEAQFVDTDGPGGNNPSAFDTIRLVANATYNASITLLNESVSPAEDITVEVEEEGVDHLFCFDLTSGLNAVITRTDLDANNLPIGITSQWVLGNASTGTSTIRLRHQPGVKNGQCDPGETDIELNFHTVIQ
ncbi:type 1 periplasmic binding fold superfamily protein [Fluviicola taffensis]|uniref:type 1 periplasmic binding fold superfamily protein n=1 Tax=Fluviicola taffensis TaxID=191579 RepID=UPI003138252A